MWKGVYDEADEFFTNTLDINPGHLQALRDSAILNMAAGKAKQAEEKIKKAMSLAADDVQLKSVYRRVRRAKTAGQITGIFSRFKLNLSKEKR